MSWSDEFIFYFNPVSDSIPFKEPGTVGAMIDAHTSKGKPDGEGASLALIGVGDGNKSAPGADAIRSQLYRLYYHGEPIRICDFGNVQPGHSDLDTEVLLREVMAPLVSRGIAIILLGGEQSLTFANYRAYEVLETTVNLALIDAIADMGEFRDALNDNNFLSRIVLHDPGFLFNISILGYQTYLNDPETLALLEKLYFDQVRLGSLLGDIRIAEPFLRNADIVSIDMNSVRNADAPGTRQPNGLTGEQICQLCKYIGYSDKTSSVGIYNYRVELDEGLQTALLIAQMLWFIIDGFSRRIREFPLLQKRDFLEYKVYMPANGEEIVFYKSLRTDKWWLNIPYSVNSEMYTHRNHIIPCSYADYALASSGEVPDIWWRTYQKLV